MSLAASGLVKEPTSLTGAQKKLLKGDSRWLKVHTGPKPTGMSHNDHQRPTNSTDLHVHVALCFTFCACGH